MFTKMQEFLRIILVCYCAFLLTVPEGSCDDSGSEVTVEPVAVRIEETAIEKKDTKNYQLPASVRRAATTSSSNATRDSQLLSVLAARRRQLLSGRLAGHISTIASIAHKPHKGNTTFAQLEIRDSNNSIVKRITFENSTNEAIAPTLRLITQDGTKETRQEIKPHEIRHLFIPRIYQENKNRAGFLNNRRKDLFNKTGSVETSTSSSIVYVPPDKGEGLDKEDDLDPEEEFQVDESNHGLYLLNYSDTDNVTQTPTLNKTTPTYEIKDNVTITFEFTTEKAEDTTTDLNKEEKTESNIIAISTDAETTKLIKINNEKDRDNQTLFMSKEIYDHFRPLETELPDEDIAPFIYFGQKLGGPVFGDNLTNSPTLAASTKAVNLIIPPSEKKKFNSRYSATEKYKNTSAGEDEINEDMDVSVVKNIIEKNKIRNTVKGPAPARHVGLVNAYRKHPSSTQSTAKPPNVAQLNVTEPMIQNVALGLTTNKTKDFIITNNGTGQQLEHFNHSATTKESVLNKTSTTPPKNLTRNYFNLRRRPSKITTLVSTESSLSSSNPATENSSTSVYTAVVTSVSITSSIIKGNNRTDIPANEFDSNSTTADILNDKPNVTEPMIIVVVNETETTTSSSISLSSYKPHRHRIRIRTTTTENPFQPFTSNAPTLFTYKPLEPTLANGKLFETKIESTTFKISEKLANLYRQIDNENSTNGMTIRPKNILKRRRPTTTTSTTTTTTSSTSTTTATSTLSTTTTIKPIIDVIKQTTEVPFSSKLTSSSTQKTTTENTSLRTLIVTSKSSSQSSSKPLIFSTSKPNNNTTTLNSTLSNNDRSEVSNEEVVIEAEKTYTASYVLAGLGILPVLAVVAFFLRNILRKNTKGIDAEYEGYFDDGGEIKKESPITPVARPPLPTPIKPDKKWEFPRNKLRLQTLLGQGNFGQVWKAEADDLNGHDGLTRLVAVKTIKESASQKEKQELLHEICIMQKIGTHPNVVTLLACCTEQEPYLLIMEYVMCGKLLTYLRERRSRPDRFSGSGALTSRDLTVFAYCVARGMDYIASKGIVHRDLAARNVLVDHNKLCKIADFGMSRCAGASARTSRGALPVRWMAPEALLYNVYSHHSDVWAFGILLWEIVTLGSTPYAAMSGREVLTAVTEGYRLERPTHCKPQLYRTMHSCWHADPNQRPSFAQLKSQLADLLDNEPSEGNYVDLDSFYQESSVYSDPSAIIHDEDGLSAEYDRERRVFRE
ncbi:mucin-4-like isoform X2 [Leptidea sinapis]|nr:mucin-4-like isoform X2 [Leptidea sinapis]